MKVSIINIGDELLQGKTLNTNSQWLGKKLSSAGCQIESQITVKDEKNSIVSGLCRKIRLMNFPRFSNSLIIYLL